MTKAELRELAEAGARQKVRAIAKQLDGLLEEFPGIFASATVPALLKPAEKAGGNDWPTIRATVAVPLDDDEEKKVDGRTHPVWTQERRAKMSRLAKARFSGKKSAQRGQPKKKTQRVTVNGAEPWGFFLWQRLHDYLATQPDHTAGMPDILKGATAKVSASVVSAVKSRPQLFQRKGRGVYRLKKIIEHRTPDTESSSS